MSTSKSTRRGFLKAMGAGAAVMSIPASKGRTVAAMVPSDQTKALLNVDPRPKYALSPYLYMQFMEPLGTTDGSVAAAWHFGHDRWREDVIEVTKKLGPPLLRWGGLFVSYYRWREAVGPRGYEPGGHGRVRRVLPPYGLRAADVHQLRVGREVIFPARPEG